MSGEFFNPFPKYLQVREVLHRRLGREFQPGDWLPTEHKLAEQFGVSRETVREALRGLEEAGLIRRRRGSGTIVIKVPDADPDDRLTGLVDDFTELKLDTHAEVLVKAVENPPPEVAKALDVSPGSPMFRIRRRRFLDGEPLSHHECFLPVEIGAVLVQSDLRNTTVLHEISTTLDHQVHEDFQRIDATVADTDMAELLGVPVGAPLLVITRAFGKDSYGPRMYFRSHFRSDRYYYTVHPTTLRAGVSRKGRDRKKTGDAEDQGAPRTAVGTTLKKVAR